MLLSSGIVGGDINVTQSEFFRRDIGLFAARTRRLSPLLLI